MKLDRKLAAILDDCLERIKAGASLESCLEQYPDERDTLESLLQTAALTGQLKAETPSEAFAAGLRDSLGVRYAERFKESPPRRDCWQGAFEGLLRKKVLWVAAPVFAVILAIALVLPGYLSQNSAFSCVLNILTGEVEIYDPATDSWVLAVEDMSLEAGDRVRTVDNSHAVLSFTSSSTVTLEPNTEVSIDELHGDNKYPVVKIKQISGRTWTSVVALPETENYFEIETAYASAAAADTQFVTEVTSNSTKIDTSGGTVKVTTPEQELELGGDSRLEIEEDHPTPVILAVPKPSSLLSVAVNGYASVSVIDPNGATTGISAAGFTVNQIPQARQTPLASGGQETSIREPAGGQYVISIRPYIGGNIVYAFEGRGDDKIAFSDAGTFYGDPGDEWLVVFEIMVEDGNLLYGNIITVQEIVDGNPPVTTTTTTSSQTAPPGTVAAGDNQDNGDSTVGEVVTASPTQTTASTPQETTPKSNLTPWTPPGNNDDVSDNEAEKDKGWKWPWGNKRGSFWWWRD